MSIENVFYKKSPNKNSRDKQTENAEQNQNNISKSSKNLKIINQRSNESKSHFPVPENLENWSLHAQNPSDLTLNLKMDLEFNVNDQLVKKYNNPRNSLILGSSLGRQLK